MPDKPHSDLRRRMLADMTIRSFSDKSRHDYLRHVETLATFLGLRLTPPRRTISGASSSIRSSRAPSRRR